MLPLLLLYIGGNGYINHGLDEGERARHKLITEIDPQSTLFFLLSRPTFPQSGKWGDFVDY